MAVALPRLSLSAPLMLESKCRTPVALSVDTKQRLRYNPHRTYPDKSAKIPAKTLPDFTPALLNSNISMSDLLKRPATSTASFAGGSVAEIEKTYLGYDRWMPSPPKVEKPRSVFNAAALAYIGDCIYELYARRHFLFPPLSIEEYNDQVMAVVRCEAQDAMLKKLIDDDYLTADEREHGSVGAVIHIQGTKVCLRSEDIVKEPNLKDEPLNCRNVLRWGKNVGSSRTRTKRRAGIAVYNRASSLETLVGYLYLTNAQRLDEMMLKLGFCSGLSNQSVGGEAEIPT